MKDRARELTALVAATWIFVSFGCDDGGVEEPDADGDVDADVDADLDADADDGDVRDGDVDGGDADADDGASASLVPPEGESSGGSGGGAASGEVRTTSGGVTYHLVAPGGAGPHPFMIVYSGTEGGEMMSHNIVSVASYTGTSSFVFAVLDGVRYRGDGHAGAEVLDEVRAAYDIDNDRTYLLSESAGTTAGLALGLDIRQSWFAAYWANDVNASGAPTLTADELGFAPFGNAGPGGDFRDARAIVEAMQAAGYRTPAPAPYDGPGSDTHGSTEQFLAAMSWFPGKSRL